ncbi:DUF6111 family protein [Methylobacterium isbiliense]|jgi:hypothetical protein|uniref:Uncharacterized protein n=1 Tax=Methylobacterium isbiliense TaxID=315478 RepID=A0ABQ4SF75_9HYPH|nr:DUF6111 family protein [Methylobacterium isbiliense]MDN3626360.1 DUF6111 family protein [Methylobacterium isbiliense]GJE01717.1 hypothetical protein GMJLKIPL_3652 [Methylobacterium isbiliense]
MIRTLLDDIALFLLPFGLYAIYLLARRRSPLLWVHWNDHALRLALAGGLLVIGSLLAAGLFGERHRTGYVPSHIENGRVVPGQFR